MRTAGLAAALFPTIVFAGCFQSTVLVKVNGDGSGRIETQTLITSAALSQLRQLAGGFGGDAKPVELFSEQQARELGSRMGDDIILLTTRPLKTGDAEGREAIYAFRDVSKLRISQTPAPPGGGAIGAGGLGLGSQSDPITINLSRSASGNMLLTLHLGANPLNAVADQTGAGNAQRGFPMPADQIALMQPMLAGMRIALRIEPAGRLVKASSPYVDGNTVTLFDVEMDTLLSDPAFKQLQTARTAAETKEALRNIKGIKLNLDPDITIEFAP